MSTGTKLVTVVKETRYVYSVEGDCDAAEALRIVRLRLDAGSPMGLESEKDSIKSYEVKEGSQPPVIFDAEAHVVSSAVEEAPKRQPKRR